MKRTKGLRKTPLRRVSKKLQIANTTYDLAKAEWRQDRINKDGYLQCQFVGKPAAPTNYSVNQDDDGRCIAHGMDSPHHRKLRGRYLSYKRYFQCLCFFHHTWVHNNARKARKRGYLLN